MRSAKSTNYDSLADLLSSAKDLTKEEPRSQQSLNVIVTAAFGTQPQKGLITPRINYYHNKNPVLWAEELESIIRLLSPQGQLLAGQGGLLTSSDYPVAIDPKILPRSVLQEFSGQGDKHSTMLKSLKRELGDKYFINHWQWYWCHLAHALVTQPEPQQKRTPKEDQQQDELFFTISRNPYLMIARKTLLHTFRKDSFLLERMRGVIELYIIEELLYATRRREGRAPELKYQLKSQCLAMMFLLIYSRKGKLTGQTMQIYQEYFIKTTEYYSAISSQGNSHNVRNIIKTWIYFLTRQHALDSSIVKNLSNANPSDGWYRLSRCPLSSWIQTAKKTTFSSPQLPGLITIRKNIYRLLSKHSEWSPSLSFLSTLQQFFLFDLEIVHKYIKKQQDKQENQIIGRCLQRILVVLAENGVNCGELEKREEKLNVMFESVLAKKLKINFGERSEEAKEKLSRSNRELAKSISYQSPRIRNVWQHPIQENQYYILFKGAYWVSQQLDRIIPGHKKRTHPCLNLRIFSNPLIFLIIFLLLAITIKTLII